ncbi:hypothetical protein DFH06DRAFT_1188131 [Mycena polygramma]|nr:hypothetical protein DFH06DRAFT_1188131 [Mycena polygramma]
MDSDSRSSGIDMYRETPSLAPINRTPAEILCYIFAFTLPSASHASSRTVHNGGFHSAGSEPRILASPWILGQVCSRWRALSVAFPALWTSISVSSNLMARHLTMLECQLRRTAAVPLNIYLRFGAAGCSSPEFDFFLPMLVSRSARWRELHLDNTLWHPHKAFEALTSASLPLLESVVFSGGQPEYLENYALFQHAPALRSIALRSRGMHFIRKLPLPWTQLTCLNLSPLSSTTGFNPILEDSLPELCNLPCLRRLAVSQSWLLGPVVTPALRSLYTTGPIEPVLSFIDRSRCAHSLSDLTLVECPSSAQTVIALLQQTANLGSLRIQPTSAPAELIASLKHLCPRLTSLSWADLDDTLGDEAFADLVIARRRYSDSGTVQRLQFAALYAGQRRRMSDRKRLRSLTNIEVVILSGTEGHPPVAQWRDFCLWEGKA